jgi:hypothetical protein
MKKLVTSILLLLAMNVSAQTMDTIKNFWLDNNNDVYCFYQLASTLPAVNRQVDMDSLNPEFSSLRDAMNEQYFIIDDTIIKVLYQNKSESYTGYERCWVVYKEADKKELKLNDLTPELQYKYYLMVVKLKKILKGLK